MEMANTPILAGLKLAAPEEPEESVDIPEPEADGLDPRVLDYARAHRKELFISEVEVPTRFRDLLPLNGPITPHTYYVPSLLSGNEFSDESVETKNYRSFMQWYEDAPGIYPVVGPHSSFAVAIRLNVVTEDMLLQFDAFADYPGVDEREPGGIEEKSIDDAWQEWASTAFERALTNKFPDFEQTVETLSVPALKALFEKMRRRVKVDWEEDGGGHAFIDVDSIANAAIPEDFSGSLEVESLPEPTPPPAPEEAESKTAATQPVMPGPGKFIPWRNLIPEGEEERGPVNRKTPDTEGFHAWFAGSKCVDVEGRPMVVFHGTSAESKSFIARNHGYGQFGHWFDATPESIEGYTLGEKPYHHPNEMAVYLSIKNPMEFPDLDTFKGAVNGRYGPTNAARCQRFRMKLKKAGYDGAVIRNNRATNGVEPDYWVAFDRKSIKSATGNSGEFSTKDHSITAADRDVEHEQISSSTDEELARRRAEIEAIGRRGARHGTPLYPQRELRELQRIISEQYNRQQGRRSRPWVTTVPPKDQKSAADEGAFVKRVVEDPFVKAYFDAALFSTTDGSNDMGGEPLDQNYTIRDFDPHTAMQMINDCEKFQAECADQLVEKALSRPGRFDVKQHGGQDFWLTRNRHGFGFWTGDWRKSAAEILTEKAKQAGPFDLEVADDGKIRQVI
jgi:hypothetical protein